MSDKINIVTGKDALISAAELKAKIENGQAIYLLDIRKQEDFEEATIEGAVHSEWEAVADLIQGDLLPWDQEIVVFCYNGQSSMQIAMVLAVQGYRAVSLLDGYNGWRQ